MDPVDSVDSTDGWSHLQVPQNGPVFGGCKRAFFSSTEGSVEAKPKHSLPSGINRRKR